MSKFCPNCGKEIEEKSAICLNCGVLLNNNNNSNKNNNNNKKSKGMPTWALVLIIVGTVIVLPIICITIIAVSTFSFFTSTDIIEEILEETDIQTGTEGDILITEDFKIKLTDAKTYDTIEKDKENKESAKEGKEYLVLFLDIENISDETNYIYSSDFNGYIESYSVTEKNIDTDIEGIEPLNANLLPGTKTKGYIVYEVDKNWTEFELCYEDWYEKKIIFTVVNKEKTNITGA